MCRSTKNYVLSMIITNEFESIFCSGRKFPISWVRKTMNNLQLPYFRLKPDTFYETLSEDELRNEFNRIEEPLGTIDELKSFQRRRTVACWHDGSPISNSSHLLIMFSAMYDKAIFYEDDEYHHKTGSEIVLYFITLGCMI